jgi:hypothetical protein
MASLLLQRGDAPAAAFKFQQAYRLYVAIEDEQGIASSLSGLATAALEGGYPATAAQILGVLTSSDAASYADSDALASAEQRLREMLGDAPYASSRALGATRDAEQVVALAVTELREGAGAASDDLPAGATGSSASGVGPIA